MTPPSTDGEKSFELVVLGAGGGPLETDVSGYMLKPARGKYEDGWISLEGGSGIGALSNILERIQDSKSPDIEQPFTNVNFPSEYDSFPSNVRSVYKAGYLYSCLSCYIITHAHLDHMASMILSTGSLPITRLSTRLSPSASSPPPKRDRRRSSGVFFPELQFSSRFVESVEHSPKSQNAPSIPGLSPAPHTPLMDSGRRGSIAWSTSECRDSLVQIYASETVLKGVEGVFEGKLWPELGWWSEMTSDVREIIDDARESGMEAYQPIQGVGVQYCPLPNNQIYQRLPLASESGISCMHLPVSHGITSQGGYESSAFFLRLDETRDEAGMEILFWGDVESLLRPGGGGGFGGGLNLSGDGPALYVDEDEEREGAIENLNRNVWKVAARRWVSGKLGAVFIECSYDSSRPYDALYGHLQPQTLYGELVVLGSLVRSLVSGDSGTARPPPLQGLKIYITHVKASLVPHPSGKTDRERVLDDLKELERIGRLGVEFVMLEKGMRVLI